jgi:hypothetical protein
MAPGPSLAAISNMALPPIAIHPFQDARWGVILFEQLAQAVRLAVSIVPWPLSVCLRDSAPSSYSFRMSPMALTGLAIVSLPPSNVARLGRS